ncbi:hypothetical protein EDB86DRAFT_2828823 [Lactarius hatsudake]|nr:hypothetical protein EDB86DRAFT_2828823 [Lactarius hatsudake]
MTRIGFITTRSATLLAPILANNLIVFDPGVVGCSLTGDGQDFDPPGGVTRSVALSPLTQCEYPGSQAQTRALEGYIPTFSYPLPLGVEHLHLRTHLGPSRPYIVPASLLEAIHLQNNFLQKLSDQVQQLAVKLNTCLPPPVATAPAPPPSKQPSAQPSPPKPPMAKPPTPPKAQTPVKGPTKPSTHAPSFASAAKAPARPSLILTPASGSSPAQAVHKTPSELCTHLNNVLLELFPGSSLSATQWTKNNNLVIIAGPDTTSHHLQKVSAVLSHAVSHFIAADSSHPIPITAKENVCWSHLMINNIPTGVSPSCGAYSPSECQDALTCDNPTYRTLRLTRLPSWVKHPNSYAIGSSSSLAVSFEDPTGDALRTLLAQKCLFAFGQAGDL